MKLLSKISRKYTLALSMGAICLVFATATLVYAATYAPSQTPIPAGSCSSSFNNGNSECTADNPSTPGNEQEYRFTKINQCVLKTVIDADYANATATTRYAQIDDGSPGDGIYTLTLNPTPPTLPSVPWPGYQWTCNAGLTCASGYVNCSGKDATNFCKLQRSNNPTWVNSTCGVNSVYSDCTDTCSCQTNYYRWNGKCEPISDIIADIGTYPWQKSVQIADQLVDGGSGTGGIRADGEIELTIGTAFSADDTVTVSYGSDSYVLTAKNTSPTRASCEFDMSSNTISTILSDMLLTIQTAGCTDSNNATPFLTYSFVDGNTLYFIHDLIGVKGTITTNPSLSGVNLRNLEHGSSYGELRNNETRTVEQDDAIYIWNAGASAWVQASGGGIDGDVLPPENDKYFIGSGETLDNVADAKIDGITTSGQFGRAIADAGDINGDGFDDIIVSAAGEGVYIFFGNRLISDFSAENADIIIPTTGTSSFGSSVASAGDVNGDGYPDVIVGDPGYNTNVGRVYIYYGGPLMDTDADVIMTGLAGDRFGNSVSTAGNVNDDGYDDVIVGAYGYNSYQGRAYVFYGSASLSPTISAGSADVTLTGEGIGNYFGASVSSAGDVDGDTIDDIIVGAWGYSTRTGRAYVFYGSASLSPTISAGSADVIFTGEGTNQNFGYSVSNAGDVNDDDYDDVIVGAYGYNSYQGRAYVFYGSASLSPTISAGSADVTLTGEGGSNQFGASVSSAGDVNNDGYNDVIVGAYGYNLSRGRAYIFYGSSSLSGSILAGNADTIFSGETAGETFGRTVSSAGDVNNDSYADVMVGANYYGASGTRKGRVYVFTSGIKETWKSIISDIISVSKLQVTETANIDTANVNNADVNSADINNATIESLEIGEVSSDLLPSEDGQYFIGSGEPLDNVADVKIDGVANSSSLGVSVANAGDVNGDGFDDIVVGASGSGARKAYIFFGGSFVFDLSPENADVVLEPGYTGANTFGFSVASAGDVNGDGFYDVIVGDHSYNKNRGRAQIYYGGETMDGTHDWQITGVTAGDQLGYSVASAGDTNDDGFDDVIVGANGYSSGKGQAYIYRGGDPMGTTANVTLNGGNTNNYYFGASVSSAGDVNDDGFDDVIVGEYGYNFNQGRAYIFYGATGTSMDSNANVTLTGSAGETFGHAVSSAGDFNGDGIDDVLVGASYYNTNTGRAYIYFGGTSMNNMVDVTFTGQGTNQRFGYSVSDAGDVNRDGYADIVVGAMLHTSSTGKAYVFYGSSSPSNTLASNADTIFSGETTGEQFGISVSSAGDINRDGYADIIVGASQYSLGGVGRGRAYIFMSDTKGTWDNALFNAANINTLRVTETAYIDNANINDVRINTATVGDVTFDNGKSKLGTVAMDSLEDWIFVGLNGSKENVGYSVAAGDVNGDGHPDVIVGAPWDDTVVTDRGAAYVHLGGPLMDNVYDYVKYGNVGDSAGYAIGAGDMNNDGYDDIAVGSPYYDSGAYSNNGRVIVYLGPHLSSIVSGSGMEGVGTNENFGKSIVFGDFNGDGFDDLAVGTPNYNSNRGIVRVYYGSTSPDSVSDYSISGAGSNELLGISLASANVNGDKYDDLIIGASGYNSNNGLVYVKYGSSSGLGPITAAIAPPSLSTNEQFGYSVANAGDINNDGYEDVLIGAPYYDGTYTDCGRAYIYYGSSSGLTHQGNITGAAGSDHFGWSVASAGDVNNDGILDILIGAPYRDHTVGNDAGYAYLFYGNPGTKNLATSGSTADKIFIGASGGDRLGYSVSGVGDINADGFDDIIIGAPYADKNGNDSGSALIYHGGLQNAAASIITDQLVITADEGEMGTGTNAARKSNQIVFQAVGEYGALQAGGMWMEVNSANNTKYFYTDAGFGTMAGSYDIAETYSIEDESIEAGDVLRIKSGDMVEKTDKAFDSMVLGVVSTQPGFLMSGGGDPKKTRPLVLTGRAPVKVTLENGPIEVGDYLTPSSTPGYAMKLKPDQKGPIVARALEAFSPIDRGDSTEVKKKIEEEKVKVEEAVQKLETVAQESLAKAEAIQEVAGQVETAEEMQTLAVATEQIAVALDVSAKTEGEESKTLTQDVAEKEGTGATDAIIAKAEEIKEVAVEIKKKKEELVAVADAMLHTPVTASRGQGRILAFVGNMAWNFGSVEESPSQLLPSTEEVCTMEIVYQTDADGNKILDEEGNPMPKLNNFGKPLKKRVCTEQTVDPQSVFSMNDPVFNTVSADKLTVKNIEVEGEIKVQKLSVSGEAIFQGKASFENQISVSDNTVDVVEVAPGENRIHVSFPKPYDKTPFIFAASRVVPTKSFIETINVNELVSNAVPSIDTLDDTILYRLIQKKLFEASDVQYRVINQTEKGFDIILEKPFCVPDELIDEIGNIKSGAIPSGKQIGDVLTCHYKLLFTWVALGSANGQSVSQVSEDITLTDEEIYQLLIESLRGRITPSQIETVEESIEPVEAVAEEPVEEIVEEVVEEPAEVAPAEEPVESIEPVEEAIEPVEEVAQEPEVIEEPEATEEATEEPQEESEMVTPETPEVLSTSKDQTPETSEVLSTSKDETQPIAEQ